MKSEIIRVLIIEDNPDSAQLILEELTEVNSGKFELKCAERLSTGLECLGKGDVDVVLLDMSLPDSNGLDTLIKVRAHSLELPIVVLTSLDEEEFAIKAVQNGAQDYLVKGSVDGNVLVRSIRYAIERHRMLKELEEVKLRLEHLAHHDYLTGLPNRHLFYDHLNKSVARAYRHKSMLAVLFLDLDEFKQINDTLGHSSGDLLLLSVSKRLTDCIRMSDIIARLGGDEFTVILDTINSANDAAKVAQKILREMSKVCVLDGQKYFVSTSIGISIYPDDGLDVETLVKKADSAMYSAKGSGKNNYKFFLTSLNKEIAT